MTAATGTAGAAAGRGGFVVSGRFLLVISFIETTALEDHPGTAADQAMQFILRTFRAFNQLLIRHGLKFFKAIPARFTFILVGWHNYIS